MSRKNTFNAAAEAQCRVLCKVAYKVQIVTHAHDLQLSLAALRQNFVTQLFIFHDFAHNCP